MAKKHQKKPADDTDWTSPVFSFTTSRTAPTKTLHQAVEHRAKVYVSLKKAEGRFADIADTRKGLQPRRLASWALSIARSEDVILDILSDKARLAAIFAHNPKLGFPEASLELSIGIFAVELERAAIRLRQLHKAVRNSLLVKPKKSDIKDPRKSARGRKKGKQDAALAIVIMGAVYDWVWFKGKLPSRSANEYGRFGNHVKKILGHIPENVRPKCPSPATIKRLIEDWQVFYGATIPQQRQKVKLSI